MAKRKREPAPDAHVGSRAPQGGDENTVFDNGVVPVPVDEQNPVASTSQATAGRKSSFKPHEIQAIKRGVELFKSNAFQMQVRPACGTTGELIMLM